MIISAAQVIIIKKAGYDCSGGHILIPFNLFSQLSDENNWHLPQVEPASENHLKKVLVNYEPPSDDCSLTLLERQKERADQMLRDKDYASTIIRNR
jgi:hypothetical protein